MNAIVPRTTVQEIVANRNRALTLYGEAHAAIERAVDAVRAAAGAAKNAAPVRNRFNHCGDRQKEELLSPPTLPSRAEYLQAARIVTDTDVWASLIAMTDLQRLMDKKAKDQFSADLTKDPPEVTVENVMATLETFAAQAGDIFKRGIAECFSELDRRFKSHDGWKIGGRIILTHAFSEFGSWNYYRNMRDAIQDVERAFYVLDGKSPPNEFAGIIGAIEESRRGAYGKRQSEAETEYFVARGYMNGNAHLWFKRDDLVEKVNKLLADYYGAVIPEDREPDEATNFDSQKTSLAKNYGFFATPIPVVDRVIEAARLYRADELKITVLEPSAGEGALALAAAGAGATVDCVEVHQERFRQLCRLKPRIRGVYHIDFLAMQPRAEYDRVIMNPPFDRERDIDHVLHAMKFLKPGGLLVSVMSAGTEFRETKKAIAFRKLVEGLGGCFNDLPSRSFASSGTNCNTIILTVRRSHPRRDQTDLTCPAAPRS